MLTGALPNPPQKDHLGSAKGPLSNGFDAMTTKRWTYPGALDAPSL